MFPDQETSEGNPRMAPASCLEKFPGCLNMENMERGGGTQEDAIDLYGLRR